ncbi:beta-lactamase-like protein [Parasitella parasitica]|nr:beta-lactamase-like protein [Parasitella parasitica]
MSTFDGRIREYPIFAIDNFIQNTFAKYFILSHVHSDHMRGLEDCKFSKRIYCTVESARIIPYIAVRHNKQPKYRHLQNFLIPVKYREIVKLDTPEYGIISFQFLPANHCVGSAMILIEGKNGSVLYTGDTRAEPDFFERNLQILKRRRIQNLYMDTTCLRETQDKFISKRRSIELLVNLIRSQEEHHHIYIDCWTFGYEECWAHVADSFNQKVHVSKLKYDTFVAANPIYKDYLTTNPLETRFHSCDWEQDCQQHEHGLISIHFKPTVDDQPRVYIYSDTSNQLLQSDLKYDCKPQTRHILPFSFHSSCTEIIEFARYVNAKTFTACVARDKYPGMDRMRKVMQEAGYPIGEKNHSSDISSSSGSSAHKKRAFSGGSGYIKIYSETLPDPESYSQSRSGSSGTWATRSPINGTTKASVSSGGGGGSLPIAPKSKSSSITEGNRSYCASISVNGSRNANQQKSNSQPRSCPASVQPLNDVTNGVEASLRQDKQHSIEGIVTGDQTCSIESDVSLEIKLVPKPSQVDDPELDADPVIVISSDDEDAKPFMTRREIRRFIRHLRKGRVKRSEFISNVQA